MTARHRWRGWLPWLAVAAGVAAFVVVAGSPATGGRPLDPRSAGPVGTKALVDTLRLLGAEVSVRSVPPGPGDTSALVLQDGLDDAARAQVRSWVDAGGTLVVADVGSPLSPAVPARGAQIAFLDPELRLDCDIPALRRVDRLEVPGAVLQRVPDTATGCFRAGGDDAFVVVVPAGAGTVVAVGGAGFLVNSTLDDADNGLLAVSLLAPTRSARVVVLEPPPPGTGSEGLLDLVDRRVVLALVQLVVAFAVLAAWRARRLGRPVAEPQPVPVAGSELVVAVGALMQRARGRRQAGALLRDDLRRWSAERLGLPAGTPPEVVAEAVAARTPGTTVEEVQQILAGASPASEDDLVTLAHSVESLRRRMGG